MPVNLLSRNKGEAVLDELSAFLRNYLKQPGSMSIRGLAKKVGVSHVNIMDVRDGKVMPRLDTAVLIAEAIGCDLSKILKTVESPS